MATSELEDLGGIPSASAPVPSMLLLARIGRAAMREFAEVLKPTALTPAHVMTLCLLRQASTSQQALADSVGVDPSKLVGLLNELEQQGLVRRRRDPADRRRHIVEISDAGAARVADAEAAVSMVEERLLGALDERQRLQLQQLLARIAESTSGGLCADTPD